MTFETTLEYNEQSYEAEITYEARHSYKETKYSTRRCFDIEVLEVTFKQFGVEVHVEGMLWQRLVWLAEESAQEHFSESGEAA